MIKYFYNESFETLSIFSDTGEYFIVEKDNIFFNNIFDACKKAESTFETIKSFLNEEYIFNIEEDDVKIYVNNNNNNVCIKNINDGIELSLPDYLKNYIIYAKIRNIPVEKYIQFFSAYSKFNLLTKNEYDSILSKSMFSINEDGSLLIFCEPNGNSLSAENYKDFDCQPQFAIIYFSNLFFKDTSSIDLKSLDKCDVEHTFTEYLRANSLEDIKFIGIKSLESILKDSFASIVENIYNLYKEFWNDKNFSFYQNEEKFFPNDMFALTQEISNVSNYSYEEVSKCLDLYSPKKTILNLIRI